MFRVQNFFKFINLKNILQKVTTTFVLTFLTINFTSCNETQRKQLNPIIYTNNNENVQFELPVNLNIPNNSEKEKVTGSSNKNKEEIDVILKTRDGLERKGVLSLNPNAKGNIVLCHAASYTKESMEDFDEKVFTDYNCLRFDFRRHGENNKKQYATLGKYEVYEVEAAVKIFKENEKTKNLPVYGFGISLGAAVLIESESKFHLFDGLILQSSFESLRKQIKRTYKFYSLPLMHNLIFREPTKFLAKKRYRLKLYKVNPVHSIKNISVPIFLMHAKNDSYIAFEAFEALYRASKTVTKTWTPEGGFHTKIYKTYPNEYAKHCNDFLNDIIAAKKAANKKVSPLNLEQKISV